MTTTEKALKRQLQEKDMGASPEEQRYTLFSLFLSKGTPKKPGTGYVVKNLFMSLMTEVEKLKL